MTEKNKSIGNFPNSGNSGYVPRLRFAEFTDGWEEKALNELGDIIGGGTPSSSNSNFWNGNIPWVSSSDIEENSIYNIRINRFITEKAINSSATKLCIAPTILIVSRVGVGKVAYSETDVCTSQDFTNVFNLKCEGIFLSYLLSIKMKKDASNLQGTSIKGIPSSEIKLKKLLIPKNNEQKKIASFLALIDDRIQTQKKILKDLESLIKGFREKIFTRKLRFQNENKVSFSSWEMKKLNYLCEIKKGEQLNKDDLNETGSYPCINGGVTFSGFTEKYNSEENTITISEGGNSCGYVNFMVTKFWLGGHCYKIILNENISKKYFYHLLKYNESKIMTLRVGSGLPNIQLKDLKNLNLFASNDFEEQTKIANFLSSIDEKIETEKKILAQYETQKKYLLANLFV